MSRHIHTEIRTSKQAECVRRKSVGGSSDNKQQTVETGLLQIDQAHRWNFSQTFFLKIKKVNNGTLQVREEAKIMDAEKEIQNCLAKLPAQSWVNL